MRNRETPGRDSTRRKDGGVSCTEGEQVLQLVHQPFSCFIKCLEAQVNQIDHFAMVLFVITKSVSPRRTFMGDIFTTEDS